MSGYVPLAGMHRTTIYRAYRILILHPIHLTLDHLAYELLDTNTPEPECEPEPPLPPQYYPSSCFSKTAYHDVNYPTTSYPHVAMEQGLRVCA